MKLRKFERNTGSDGSGGSFCRLGDHEKGTPGCALREERIHDDER